MKILLVEDDKTLAKTLDKVLSDQHYLVEIAADGVAGWELAEAFEYDLILLDAQASKLDGIRFCRQLRARGDRTPVLLMAGQDERLANVAGLDAGADDYVMKPFERDELLARIRALLRRTSATASPILTWDELRLDPIGCEVTYRERILHLTAKEYALMELFLRHPRRIFSQSALLDRLWSVEEAPSESAVRTHIKGLRRKLKQAGAEDAIETVYGLGYRLKAKAASERSEETARNVVPADTQKVLWEQYKEQYVRRLHALADTIATLAARSTPTPRQPESIKEARALKDALSRFGFSRAAELLGEIETLAATPLPWDEKRGQAAETLTRALEKAIAPALSPEAIASQCPARLLIIDGDAALSDRLLVEARNWGLETQVAANLDSARETIATVRPDVVLLDPGIAESVEAGYDFLSELAGAEPPIPALVFSTEESFRDRVRAARAGGRGFLPKTLAPAQIMAAIAQVLQQSGQPEANLLLLDSDLELLDSLRALLDPWGFKLTLLDDPAQFWDVLRETDPDLLILGWDLPELSGGDICRVVRNDPLWNELPVLVAVDRADTNTVQEVFAAGADDYVPKPIAEPELIARVLNRIERARLYRKFVEFDPLTGLKNRQQSIREMTQLLRLAGRQEQSFCLAILALDEFGSLARQHGRETSDRVLRRCAELLLQTFRGEDIVARWGEEEFAIGLYGASQAVGVKRLETVLQALQDQEFTSESETDKTPFRASFSAGAAEYPRDGSSLEAIYRSAEVTLAGLRDRGRGQIGSPELPAN